MPADDDVVKPAGGLGSGKNEGRRLLRAVTNDQLIAIDADRWAGAAHHDHAVLDDGVVRVIRMHAHASAFRGLGESPAHLGKDRDPIDVWGDWKHVWVGTRCAPIASVQVPGRARQRLLRCAPLAGQPDAKPTL
jgi:hypothetical protein